MFEVETTCTHVSKWLQEPVENEANVPLVITSADGHGKQAFIINWLQQHIKQSKKNYPDILIPSFITYYPGDSSANHIIYQIMIQLKEIFNIRRKLDLSEERLRINFYYWLDLASRKLQQLKYYDGDLVILIDGVDFLPDQEKHPESSLKFWVPK